jgi:hypothetical protein
MVSLANLVQKKTAVGTRAPSQPITGLPLSCDIYCWNWEETVFLCLSNIFLCIAIKSFSMLLLLAEGMHILMISSIDTIWMVYYPGALMQHCFVFVHLHSIHE